MTEKLTTHVTSALDVCAPLKTFIIRDQHKFGLSTVTKNLIRDRDQARKEDPAHKVQKTEKQS